MAQNAITPQHKIDTDQIKEKVAQEKSQFVTLFIKSVQLSQTPFRLPWVWDCCCRRLQDSSTGHRWFKWVQSLKLC